MNLKSKKRLVVVTILLALFALQQTAFGQVEATDKKYIRLGSLQSHISAYGSERAWNNVYYEGMRWPALYSYQDNAVIKRSWIGCQNFKDELGRDYNEYAIYITAGFVGEALFPVELSQVAKYNTPQVYVDGDNTTSIYAGDVDEVDPTIIADRIITNVVNTSMGLTMTRRLYAFSQQYHDNYFIKEFKFENTGNIDYDDEIELSQSLEGIRVSWGTRYSGSREASFNVGGTASWGKHMWVTRRGETYAANAGTAISENTPTSGLEWLRYAFSWLGQRAENAYDNIGGPRVTGSGRLTSPHHIGEMVLLVDYDKGGPDFDKTQPVVLGWHAGDTYPAIAGVIPAQAPEMTKVYTMISGNPYQDMGGTNRMYEDNETNVTNQMDPFTIHNDGGGTNIWIAYGPFDLDPGESFTIWEAQGISGLSREMCEEIGFRWKKAYEDPNDKGPFDLPNGSTTDDKDVFKNLWIKTGWDSIAQTMSRAKRNFDSGFNIPNPPAPPDFFDVTSGGDRISLTWTPSPDEASPDFGGYRIYRALSKPDTTFELIFECGKGTGNDLVNAFDDISPVRGFVYYYYIVAFNDGSNNSDGLLNPTGELYSSLFLTRTTKGAYLRRQAGESLSEIRVVPNPYNLKARTLNYPGEPNKIGFLNIPAFCTIKIYTERGDLIQTIDHSDGSGDEFWNLITSSRQTVVSGIYIAYFEVAENYRHPQTGKLLYKKGDSTFRKFVVIR